jgi:hypothetical protein
VTLPFNTLVSTYSSVARSWSAAELAGRYRAASLRGESDVPADEPPPARPIGLLTTAIPRLISLAVAANILHVLPTRATQRPAHGAKIVTDLFATLDETAAGSLHRCHLALAASGPAHDSPLDEWLPYVHEETAEELRRASPTAEPPSLIDHAEQAGRWAALAIGALDRDAPTAPQAIADCLAHLLFACVFADLASGRQSS